MARTKERPPRGGPSQFLAKRSGCESTGSRPLPAPPSQNTAARKYQPRKSRAGNRAGNGSGAVNILDAAVKGTYCVEGVSIKTKSTVIKQKIKDRGSGPFNKGKVRWENTTRINYIKKKRRPDTRACIQLRRIVTAANCTPARKFLASLS
jgi:hypothetical protein